ncbi:hypothetical protein KR018_008679, partial [Drosophila ironensis]
SMDYKRVAADGTPSDYSISSPSAPPLDMGVAPYQPPEHLYPPVPPYQEPAYQPVPQMQMAQMPQPATNVVHHMTTVVVDNPGRGMICPKCNARVQLRTDHHPTGMTYLMAALLCLFCCWPCVCVPCCCNCYYKTSQFCPNCKACMGTY